MPALTEMVRGVKELGLETCMTLGMLTSRRRNSRARASTTQPQPRHVAGFCQVISTRTRIASTRSTACVTRASTCVAAASSAWANRAANARA